jgi:Zn-finger nucleic acid-binding protein
MNCPSCGAAMELAGNRRHFHCAHCNNFHFPEETGDGVAPLEDPAGCDCPVCHVPLHHALIDGQPAAYCGRCRGFLAATATFGLIVAKRRALHGSHEQISEPFDRAELKRMLHCPSCHQRMDAHPYFGGGNAVVDTCERCGLIWLDAGELAIIERYIPHVHQIEAPLTLAPNDRHERDLEGFAETTLSYLARAAWGLD